MAGKKGDRRVEGDVKAALGMLHRLIAATGFTHQQIDRMLGLGRGYTSRLLAGQFKLTYSHILEILYTIGVEPSVFFAAIHGERQRRERVDRQEIYSVLEELGIVPKGVQAKVSRAPGRLEEERLARIEAAINEVLIERGARDDRD